MQEDKPFFNARDDGSNFVISFGRSPRHDFPIFARGYFRAASQLAEALLAKARFGDHEAYPVVFLYRHAFELYLKGIIYNSARLASYKEIEGLDNDLKNVHELQKLARPASESLSVLFPEERMVIELMNVIRRVAADFDRADPRSFSYRYPITQDGELSTERNQIMNLRSLHETMRTLCERLEVLNFGINVETDQARDIYPVIEEARAIFRGE